MSEWQLTQEDIEELQDRDWQVYHQAEIAEIFRELEEEGFHHTIRSWPQLYVFCIEPEKLKAIEAKYVKGG